MGWGGFLDKLLDKVPIQGRVERWKNEKANLLKEKGEIERMNLDITNEKDRKKAERYTVVIKRIDYLNQLLVNKT